MALFFATASETRMSEQNLVLAQKVIHKGAMFRAINSQATIPLEGLFGLRMTRINDDFVSLELITGGKEKPVRYEYKTREKVVKVVKEKSSIVEEDGSQKSLVTEELE